MTRPGPRRRRAPLLAAALAAAALAILPGAAFGQGADCPALRAALDAPPPPADPGRLDAAMQHRRDEIARLRATADRTGCGDGAFDDPDAQPCRAIARRVEMLEVGLQRLQDQAFRGDPADDGRRRDLQARFDAECTAAEGGEPPAVVVPVDPDAPPGPAASPRVTQVICVRRCDGFHYPLAVDVAPDRMGDMDRICQAQCPAAESSAYASPDGDVSDATAADGSSYASLPAAFAYLKGPSRACACRGPHQSWAEALAGAEALLQPHKGDVTVTAAISAAMARPAAIPGPATPAPRSPRKAKPTKAAPPVTLVPPPSPGLDLTREFRGSDPTL